MILNFKFVTDNSILNKTHFSGLEGTQENQSLVQYSKVSIIGCAFLKASELASKISSIVVYKSSGAGGIIIILFNQQGPPRTCVLMCTKMIE